MTHIPHIRPIRQRRERLDVIAQQEHTTTVMAGVEEETEVQHGADGGHGDVRDVDVLVQMLSSLSIRDSRKAIELVFKNHGGGELRMVGMALNVSLPSLARDTVSSPLPVTESPLFCLSRQSSCVPHSPLDLYIPISCITHVNESRISISHTYQ